MSKFTYWKSQSNRMLTHWQSGKKSGDWEYIDLLGKDFNGITREGTLYTLPPCFVLDGYVGSTGGSLGPWITENSINYNNMVSVNKGVTVDSLHMSFGCHDLGSQEMKLKQIPFRWGLFNPRLTYHTGEETEPSFKKGDTITVNAIIPTVHRYLVTAFYGSEELNTYDIPEYVKNVTEMLQNYDNQCTDSELYPFSMIGQTDDPTTEQLQKLAFFAYGDAVRNNMTVWHKKTKVRRGSKLREAFFSTADGTGFCKMYGFNSSSLTGESTYKSGGLYEDSYPTSGLFGQNIGNGYFVGSYGLSSNGNGIQSGISIPRETTSGYKEGQIYGYSPRTTGVMNSDDMTIKIYKSTDGKINGILYVGILNWLEQLELSNIEPLEVQT